MSKVFYFIDSTCNIINSTVQLGNDSNNADSTTSTTDQLASVLQCQADCERALRAPYIRSERKRALLLHTQAYAKSQRNRYF